MKDKNGVEIRSGMIVEISGAYFKRDNGLYFVQHSPGDPGWSGKDHCMQKISKAGKISQAKYNLCFWPIGVFVNDRVKCAEAKRWNAEHAQIEVKPALSNMSEVAGYFQEKAQRYARDIDRVVWRLGEDNQFVQQNREIMKHYEAVAAAIEG